MHRFSAFFSKLLPKKGGEESNKNLAVSSVKEVNFQVDRREAQAAVYKPVGQKTKVKGVEKKGGKRRHPSNNVFQSHREIREALRSLRDDDKKIIDYTEEARTNSLFYEVKIREDKRPLGVHFVHPGKGWQRETSAYNIQIFLPRVLSAHIIKGILLKQVEARIKGWRHEERGLRLLKELKVELEAKSDELRIKEARFATEEEDKKTQIDYVAILEYGGRELEMPLQSKSSLEGREAHKKSNPQIPSIMITGTRTDEKLKSKLVYIMHQFLNGKIAHR